MFQSPFASSCCPFRKRGGWPRAAKRLMSCVHTIRQSDPTAALSTSHRLWSTTCRCLVQEISRNTCTGPNAGSYMAQLCSSFPTLRPVGCFRVAQAFLTCQSRPAVIWKLGVHQRAGYESHSRNRLVLHLHLPAVPSSPRLPPRFPRKWSAAREQLNLERFAPPLSTGIRLRS